MKPGHFHPLVSRRVTANVEIHCGANTNQARKASAVGRLHAFRRLSTSEVSTSDSSPCRGVDGAERRDRDLARRHAGDEREAISWLKPIGRTMTSSPVAMRPAIE